jgi:hypothetical protein
LDELKIIIKRMKLEEEDKVSSDRAIAQAVSGWRHRAGPDSNPDLVLWDLWWTKWHWGRFSPSTSVSLANSTNFSTITITYHLGLV